MVGASIIIICILVGYFVVVRPFDKLTNKHEGLLDMLAPVRGGWFRFMKYSVAIALPNYVRSTKQGVAIYSDFHYRGHASAAQVAISYLFVVCTVIVLGCGVLAYGVDKFYGLEEVPLFSSNKT